MPPPLRRVASYLPLAALALLAAWPLLRYGPPSVIDGPIHFYRLVELDWHVRNGLLYPRWFADLHYGFGAPVLNYYAPLSYYVLLGLHWLGLPLPTAFLGGFVLTVVVAMAGMYLWGREQFDSALAGLTAAAAYALTPYFYFNLLGRGSYPEMWGLALAPWLFWCVLRLTRRPASRAGLALTVLYAALILTHNLSAVLLSPLLMLYGLALLWLRRTATLSSTRQALIGLALSLAHGAGLAAFFVVPFLLEASFVQLERASDLYNFRYFFLTLSDLFSRPIPFDPDLVINPIPISLPWPQLALALVAVGSAAARPAQAGHPRWIVLFLALLLAGLAFLTQPAAFPLWEAFGPARLIQFPWRLVGPATLLLAWLAGAGVARLAADLPRRVTALLAMSAFFAFSLTWTYHEDFDPYPTDPSPADVVRFEIAHPHIVGTTSSLEFLPRWVSALPEPEALLAPYQASALPSRLSEVPDGVTVTGERNGLTITELNYRSAQPFSLRVDRFYFPGWAAVLDGRSWPVGPSGPHGLITLSLPAGEHTLRLELRPTRAQWFGGVLSLGAAGLLLLRLRARKPGAGNPPERAPALSPALAALFGGLLLLRVVLLDRVETWFWQRGLATITQPLSANFDDQVDLLGSRFSHGPTVTSGAALDLTLFWRARQPLTTGYQTTVQLVDRYGVRFGHTDNLPQWPTSAWQVGKYTRDEHHLISLAGTPPGDYQLRVGVYRVTEQGATQPLSIREGPSPVGVEFDLGTVRVLRPPPQPADSLRLVESRLLLEAASVGDRLPFEMVWHSGSTPLPALTAEVNLTNLDGRVVYAGHLPPASPDYPTDEWELNELVRYRASIILPPDLTDPAVRVTLRLVDSGGLPATGWFDLGQLSLSVPERSYEVPPMANLAGHDFGGAIRLLGYDVTADEIILYWQALQVVEVPLTVFVHRFDAQGVFVGGHDSPPPRPTTSWLPGEVLVDVHPISVGERFQVGLYDPLSGARFGEPFMPQP